jgi:hypothetical protein
LSRQMVGIFRALQGFLQNGRLIGPRYQEGHSPGLVDNDRGQGNPGLVPAGGVYCGYPEFPLKQSGLAGKEGAQRSSPQKT